MPTSCYEIRLDLTVYSAKFVRLMQRKINEFLKSRFAACRYTYE